MLRAFLPMQEPVLSDYESSGSSSYFDADQGSFESDFESDVYNTSGQSNQYSNIFACPPTQENPQNLYKTRSGRIVRPPRRYDE